MNTIENIIVESTSELQEEISNNKEVTEKLIATLDDFGEFDLEKLIPTIIEISTEFSNSNLLKVLSKMKDEGYFLNQE